jgi:RNA recognition motif-containing protein
MRTPAAQQKANMSTDYSPGGSRDQRRGRRRRRQGRDRRSQSVSTTPSQPKKKNFWQSLVAFFGGGERTSSETRSNSRPESRRSEGRREAPREERARQPRPPVTVDVTSPRLYVGNLSFDATESDLLELFSGAGSVVSAEVVCSRHNQRSKGFAFVQMQTIEEAKRAADELHDKEYMGRKLLISGAKAPEGRAAERSTQPEQ